MNTRPNRRTNAGITWTELIVVVVSLLLLFALLLPALTRPKRRSSRINCSNNLKQIGLAFKTWALDNNDRFPMQVPISEGGSLEFTNSGQAFQHFAVMSNELSTPKILACPTDSRAPTTNFSLGFGDGNISYFLNLDAKEGGRIGAAYPNSNSLPGLLCGDRNITNLWPGASRVLALNTNLNMGWTKDLHSKKGNLAFQDGSVGGFENGAPLRKALETSATANHRLLLP